MQPLQPNVNHVHCSVQSCSRHSQCLSTHLAVEHRWCLLHFSMTMLQSVLSPRPRPRSRQKLQDQDQDRHWSETGLVIRSRSQTTTLHAGLGRPATLTDRQRHVPTYKVCSVKDIKNSRLFQMFRMTNKDRAFLLLLLHRHTYTYSIDLRDR